jgi:hypothetical protein
VHNLRAQPTARLRFGRVVEEVAATEVAGDEQRAVARAYWAAAGRDETRARLAWAADGAPEEEARRGAVSMPVFRLRSARARD